MHARRGATFVRFRIRAGADTTVVQPAGKNYSGGGKADGLAACVYTKRYIQSLL